MEQARYLRPMGVGDLLDRTFQLLRHNLRTFVGIAAAVMLPQMVLQIVQLVIVGPVLFDFNSMTGGPSDPTELIGATAFFAASTAVITIVSLVLYILMMAAFTWAVAQRFLGEAASVGAAYRHGWSCFWRTLWANALAAFLVTLVGAALIAAPSLFLWLLRADATAVGIVLVLAIFVWLIAAVYLFVRWAFITPATVIEHAGIRAALARSAALVKGSGWRVLAVLLFAFLIYYFVAAIPSMVVQLVLMSIGTLISPGSFYGFMIASVAGASLFYLIAAPLLPTVVTLLYYDMRVRKEAFDLALLAGLSYDAPGNDGGFRPTAPPDLPAP